MPQILPFPSFFTEAGGNQPASQLDANFAAVTTSLTTELQIASATATDLGSLASNVVAITGTSTISSFGSSAVINQPLFFIRAIGSFTIAYNATSMITLTGGNIVINAGDQQIWQYLNSGNWKQIYWSGLGAVSTASPVGFRNRVINGDFRVAQRGTSGTATNAAYTLDRFLTASGGNPPTWQQATTTPPGSYSENAFFINGVAGNTSFNIQHRIESRNSRDLAGQSVTCSYWVYQTTGSSVTVTTNFYQATATDNFTSITNIGTPAGTVVPNTTWTKVIATQAIPSTAITGLGVTLWAQGTPLISGNSMYVCEVQLELGTVPTIFERLPMEVSLANCQRYFEPIDIQLFVSGNTQTGYYKVTKLFSPAFTYVGGNNVGGTIAAMATGANSQFNAYYQSAYASTGGFAYYFAVSEL